MLESCTLCGLPAKTALLDEERPFCCMGCLSVYEVLKAQHQLQACRDSPIFKQALASGLISNPKLLEELEKENTEPVMEKGRALFELSGLYCPSCAKVIEWVLRKERGVLEAHVDYYTDLAVVYFSLEKVSKQTLLEKIRALGYGAQTFGLEEQEGVLKNQNIGLALAIFSAMNIMMFSYPIYFEHFGLTTHGFGSLFAQLSFLMALPLLYCFRPMLKACLQALRLRIFGMETLVSLGVLASFFLSTYNLYLGSEEVYFDSLSMIIVFVLLGKSTESKAKFSAKLAQKELASHLPKKGRKQTEAGLVYVPIKEVAIDDELIVTLGEKLPLDGICLSKEVYLDCSHISGEAKPVKKREGEPLPGGAILRSAQLNLRVTSTLAESTLAQIIQWVESGLRARGEKPPFLDRLLQYFVPAIVVLASASCLLLYLQGAGLSASVIRAASILLISCPCAIGIAEPLAQSFLRASLAKTGALVRHRQALETLGEQSLILFDKTGTLTEGTFALQEGLNELSSREKARLKAMVARSLHPISRALFDALDQEKGVEEETPDEFEVLVGAGLKARWGKDTYLLGSARFVGTASSKEPLTQVYFKTAEAKIHPLKLGDQLQEGIKTMVQSLQKQGQNLAIVSGDEEGAVAEVAEGLGIKNYYANCSPIRKQQIIKDLQGKSEKILFVGDGINDAPAITVANWSFSPMKAADLCMNVSDFILTRPLSSCFLPIFDLCRRGQRVVKQNLFWAFFYNVLMIPLAVMGYLAPVMAALAMILSSAMVVTNSRRLQD